MLTAPPHARLLPRRHCGEPPVSHGEPRQVCQGEEQEEEDGAAQGACQATAAGRERPGQAACRAGTEAPAGTAADAHALPACVAPGAAVGGGITATDRVVRRGALQEALDKEKKMSKWNLAKIQNTWRKIMRLAKVESLRKDIEIVSQNHERDVDRKDAIIQMLDRDVEEAEEQYQIALRQHLRNMDRLIDLQVCGADCVAF